MSGYSLIVYRYRILLSDIDKIVILSSKYKFYILFHKNNFLTTLNNFPNNISLVSAYK